MQSSFRIWRLRCGIFFLLIVATLLPRRVTAPTLKYLMMLVIGTVNRLAAFEARLAAFDVKLVHVEQHLQEKAKVDAVKDSCDIADN
eukprot:7443989-Karenia_brevis.AAC.1